MLHVIGFGRLVKALVGCLALLSVLVGCSTGLNDGLGDNPYAAEFREIYELTSSDYVKSIVEDGKIEPFELQDAQQRMVTCMADAGYTMDYYADEFGYTTTRMKTGVGTDMFTDEEMTLMYEQMNKCRVEWMGPIDMLDWDIKSNPNNQDWDGLVAACLVRHGVVTEGFTGQDYAEVQSQQSGTEVVVDADNPDTWVGGTAIPDGSPVPVLPGGRSLDDPQVWRCQNVPLQ